MSSFIPRIPAEKPGHLIPNQLPQGDEMLDADIRWVHALTDDDVAGGESPVHGNENGTPDTSSGYDSSEPRPSTSARRRPLTAMNFTSNFPSILEEGSPWNISNNSEVAAIWGLPQQRNWTTAWSTFDPVPPPTPVSTSSSSSGPSTAAPPAQSFSSWPVIGTKAFQLTVNGELNYQLQSGPQVFLAGEEVSVYLVPEAGSSLASSYIPATVSGIVTFASGKKMMAELQKLDVVPGYKVTFTPPVQGSLCVMIQKEGENGAPTQLCPPLELTVSRNYLRDSSLGNSGQVRLAYNGGKYWGISSDGWSDRLFITDRASNQILVMDPTRSQCLGQFGAEAGLYRPTGMVVDKVNRRLLVCDKDNHRVAIFTTDGKFLSSFGKKGHANGEFNYPWDIDLSPDGNMIAVTDSRNHRVQMFDRFGNFVKKFSIFEEDPFEFKSKFDYPRGIVFSKCAKYLFITDFNNHKLLRLKIDDLTFVQFPVSSGPPHPGRPQGLTLDKEENVVVCDSKRNALSVVTKDGQIISQLTHVGRNKLLIPVDVCVMREERLAVMSINGHISYL